MMEEILSKARKHHQAGRLAEAEALYLEILRNHPDDANVLHLLGLLEFQSNRPSAAIDHLRKSIDLAPGVPEYFYNLGLALMGDARGDEAIDTFRRAVELRPEFSQACNALGTSLAQNGKTEEAMVYLRRALKLDPKLPDAWNNLGYALWRKREWEESHRCMREALSLFPEYAEAYNNLGMVLQSKGMLEESIVALRRALELKPNYANAHNNMGNALQASGLIEEAEIQYERACAIRPDFTHAHSNRLYSLYFHPEYDSESIFRRHREWNDEFARPLGKLIQPHTNDRSPDRRLRIGYVSPDFRDHAESFFTIPLLSAHDHSRFEIFCYSGVMNEDKITERLRGYADVWRNIAELSDTEAVELIRSDQIDILVDLTMHMANGRPMVFARKPAPIQVAWLAYPGTTGLETMDYRLTDGWIDPLDQHEKFYSEESILLPDCWCCYDSLSDVKFSPVRQSGPIRFGSLNNPRKLNEKILKIWRQVLAAVPDSRLLLLANSVSHRERILRLVGNEDIHLDRIEFIGSLPRSEYLKSYDSIDIGLDPLPYNGITTTCDAMWMGVPVVSLMGNTAAGRAGLSILQTVGLGELEAGTPEDFVKICANLAGDARRLASLRQSLRDRMRNSPLMDAKCFAKNVESAFRDIWRRWAR